MSESHKSMYQEVIKSFFMAFKRLSLYSASHPLSKEIVENLLKIFAAILKDEPEILMVIGSNADEMIVNREVLYRETLGVPEIYEKFKNFKLDGISFLHGLTLDELAGFIKAMAASSATDGGRPASLPELLHKGSEHIKIKKVRYEKVDEDEKVVFKQASAQGSGQNASARADDIFSSIKDFLLGKKGGIEQDAGLVLEELENNVSKIAQTIIESAKESGDFEGVIKKFVKWISEHMAPLIVEKKRDPSKFIMKIFDSLKKEDSGVSPLGRDALIEECADEIKMAMIEDAFVLQKSSPGKALSHAAKILSDEEDGKRILPKLSQRLIKRGAVETEANSFVQNVEKELLKDEEVLISKKKLQRLMRITERFQEEVNSRVREATGELTKLNKQLAYEKETSEGIMRHLADGLVVVDKTGKILMMNPAAEKLLNKDMKDVVGKTLADSLKDEHLLAVAKSSLESNGESLTKEIEFASKNESTKKTIRASSAVVENEDGKTVGMVSVLSDITREKELDELKSHFVSLVTHELRTPIVAIQKSLELILSKQTGEINEDQAKFLSISKSNLDRLNRLVNELLDISRLEAGKFVLNISSFDFRDIVNEVVATLQNWAGDKQIVFKLDLKETQILVNADRDRMVQVLVNLVGNALKFTPVKGEISITLNPLDRKEGICSEACLEVSVTDTGIGIDQKDFKRIFNKFEQVGLVSPVGVAGTGLGLTISKQIINLHGGNIWVESQKGEGSKFIFAIPRFSKSLNLNLP